TLTAALYDLTAYPEHLIPMRQEVERVVEAEGWSKESLANMHNIDSFSVRLGASTSFCLLQWGEKSPPKRVLLSPTAPPYRTMAYLPGIPTHCNDANYENPEIFDGFHFSHLREEHPSHDADGPDGFFNRYMVTTGLDHVVFGHGRHAWPGRFFAATELKTMIARILINYDVKAC
ncbi:cytochrome P450, partial [Mycena leptocephala]